MGPAAGVKLFIDSANLDEIREIHRWGVLAGVTTNPSLVAKAGGDLEQVVKEAAALVRGPVSAEVVATDTGGMVAEGRRYAAWDPHVVVKVPLTAQGLAATRALADLGIATNVTLVFSAAQALLAARAGATYVSPFLGRVDDVGWEGLGLVREIAEIFRVAGLPTQIIAASIRHPGHVTASARAGAHIATLPAAVFRQLLHHPLTEAGIERFLADWEKAQAQKAPAR